MQYNFYHKITLKKNVFFRFKIPMTYLDCNLINRLYICIKNNT